MLRIALRYGLWMALGFIGFFFIMHLFGLSRLYWLRVFNGVIQAAFIWYALRAWYREHPDRIENYASGVAVGMGTTFVGTVPFMIVMAVFFAFNPEFMYTIQEKMHLSYALDPITASSVIMMEATCIGLILSYIQVRVIEMMYERRQNGN